MALSLNTKKLIIRIVLFLVYLLVGAAIFQAIELQYEREQRREDEFEAVKENFTSKYNISDKDMKAFLAKLKKALELGFDLQTAKYPNIDKWHFMNAFFFAGNVVTTIGESHSYVSRRCWFGKIQRVFSRLVESRVITCQALICLSNKATEREMGYTLYINFKPNLAVI